MTSVVVPAHDEESTIGACLAQLTSEAGPGQLDVVVVCNGCSDRTSQVASSFPVRVVETPVASKAHALNLGDEHAVGFPRFYLDADVRIGTGDVVAMAQVLASGQALVASPRPHLELADRPWRVRAYYRLWRRLPSVEEGVVGAGVYGFSEQGRSRFARFPDLVADDYFVRLLFTEGERVVVPAATSIVAPARTLGALVRRKVRIYRGNREVRRHLGVTPARRNGWMEVVREDPRLLPCLVPYLYVTLAGKFLARFDRGGSWGRDETSR